MPLNPGNDTITFQHSTLTPTTGNTDKYGIVKPDFTTSVVNGCALQPVSQKDDVGATTHSEATHVCLSPATTFTMAMVPDDYLFDAAGVKYRIVGTRHYRDDWGRTDHITFLCEYEVG